MADPADSAVWDAIAELERRATLSERSLDRHLGQCEERHKEIVRRQEESTRDRSQLRIDIERSAAETRRVIEETRRASDVGAAKFAGLGWAIAGATATALLTLGLKVLKII